MPPARLMVRVQPIYVNNISGTAADEARRVNIVSAARVQWLIFAILRCLGTSCSRAALKSGKHFFPLRNRNYTWGDLEAVATLVFGSSDNAVVVASRTAVEEM